MSGLNLSSHAFPNFVSSLFVSVKQAAKILGYSKRRWDYGIATWSEKKGWNDLTKKQQKAAGVMGYTQEKWDGTSTTKKDGEDHSTVVPSVSADPALSIVDPQWIDGERFEI
jgi:hypothetical protein